MSGDAKLVLVALSADLQVAHRAYLKSLGAAGFDVATLKTVEEFLERAGTEPALIVLGAATGLPGVSGLELLKRLGELETTPVAPVLLLHGATGALDTPLRVLRKWTEARQALGLDQPKTTSSSKSDAPRQPLVKLKSVEPTLELTKRPVTLPGVGGAMASPPPAVPVAESPPPPAPAEEETAAPIVLTDADRISDAPFLEPDTTEEVSEPPPFAAVPAESTGEEEPDTTEEVSEPPPFAAPAPAPAPVQEEFPPASLEAAESSPMPPQETEAPLAASPLAAQEALPDDTVDHLLPKSNKKGVLIAIVLLLAGAVIGGGAYFGMHLRQTGSGQGERADLGGGPVVQGPDAAADHTATGTPDGAESPPETPDATAAASSADGGTSTTNDTSDGGSSESPPASGDEPQQQPGGEDAASADDAILLPLRFRRNSAHATITSRRELSEVIRLLTKNRRTEIVLTGHASPDERPSRQEALGRLRAREARDVLSSRGPSRRRFTLVSAAATSPVRDGDEQARNIASRRVTLRLVER